MISLFLFEALFLIFLQVEKKTINEMPARLKAGSKTLMAPS